jgi:hypothetical protein
VSGKGLGKGGNAMGSGYNLPDGCYDSDLPGYYDEEETVELDCPECGRTFTTDVCYDRRDDDYQVTCETTDGGCGAEWSEYTPHGYCRAESAEMRDDDDRYDAQDHPRY